MRLPAYLLVLLGCACLSASCTAADDKVVLPTLNAGDAWTFRSTAEDPVSQTKTSTMQFDAVAVTASGDIAWTVQVGDLTHFVRDAKAPEVYNMRPISRTPCMFDPIGDPSSPQTMQISQNVPCPFPASAGLRWTRSDRFLDRPLIRTSVVVGVDEVSVPAGRFHALKVEETIAGTEPRAKQEGASVRNIEQRCEKWYAAEAKIVVKEVCEYYLGSPTMQHRNTFELVLYRLR